MGTIITIAFVLFIGIVAAVVFTILDRKAQKQE